MAIELLGKQGVLAQWERFKFTTIDGLNIPPTLADSMEEIADLHPTIDFLRRYTKLYEITHRNLEEPAWIMAVCDLNRPVTDRRPLMVDVMKEILDAHPAELAILPIVKAGSLEKAASLRDLFNHQAEFLRNKYPLVNELFALGLTGAAAIVDYPIDPGSPSNPSPFLNDRYRVLAEQHTLQLVGVLKNIRVVVGILMTVAKLFEVVYRDIKDRLDAEERERQTQAVENELHDWSRDPGRLEGSSNHTDAFDRNHARIGGLA